MGDMMDFFDLIRWHRIKWYRLWSRSHSRKACQSDPFLTLYGSGKELWSDEHRDEYVARLRAGWE
jgi:hypothetical protein